jgi:hypothetical protein
VPAKPNANETTEIKIRPPVQIGEYLDSLIKTGLYGNSRTEAVMLLVRDQIIHLRKEGRLKREGAKKI